MKIGKISIYSNILLKMKKSILYIVLIFLLVVALFLYDGDRAKLIPVCFLFLVAVLSIRKKKDNNGK
jgi:hypothetical protein